MRELIEALAELTLQDWSAAVAMLLFFVWILFFV